MHKVKLTARRADVAAVLLDRLLGHSIGAIPRFCVLQNLKHLMPIAKDYQSLKQEILMEHAALINVEGSEEQVIETDENDFVVFRTPEDQADGLKKLVELDGIEVEINAHQFSVAVLESVQLDEQPAVHVRKMNEIMSALDWLFTEYTESAPISLQPPAVAPPDRPDKKPKRAKA